MTRTILFSILMIGALLVAVAGITFAVFSDNVASDKQEFIAGEVDILVNGDEDDYFNTSIHMTDMAPGDSKPAQPISINNDGSLPVFYHIWTYIGGDIYNCDPNPACNLKVEFDGPTGGVGPDYALEVDETETYELSSEFPLCAGNSCQGKDGYIQLFIHAWQQKNLEDYTCIKLEDKAAPDWLPDALSPAHGNMCYMVDGTDLKVVVNGYKLNPDKNFQLSLDGGGEWDPDGPCLDQDRNLAGMPGDQYVSGFWNTGPGLDTFCTPGKGEGVWNYAGVYSTDPPVTSDSTGAFSYQATLSGLQAGVYEVKANVKEVTGALPGTGWESKLSGLDYLRFTIPAP